jgi:ankyrin repeat protein
LRWEVSFLKIEAVRFLLNHGAAINVTDSYWQTPLHFAAMEGHFEVVKFLVETERANTYLWNRYYATPYDLATMDGYDDIATFLLLNKCHGDLEGQQQQEILLRVGRTYREDATL